MNLEIPKRELAQRVQLKIQSGSFHDVDALIEKTFDDVDLQVAAAPPTATGAVVLAALQAPPYRDIDLTPQRVRLMNAARRAPMACGYCASPRPYGRDARSERFR